jgi:hypothetical protein
MPFSVTGLVLLPAASVALNVPTRLPSDVGAKLACTAQLPPGARVMPLQYVRISDAKVAAIGPADREIRDCEWQGGFRFGVGDRDGLGVAGGSRDGEHFAAKVQTCGLNAQRALSRKCSPRLQKSGDQGSRRDRSEVKAFADRGSR